MSEEKKAEFPHRRIWFGDACDEWALSPGNGWEEYISLQEAQERERLLTEALERIAKLSGDNSGDKTRWKLAAQWARETLAKIRGTNG